jgi:alpha-L-fucosidase 2
MKNKCGLLSLIIGIICCLALPLALLSGSSKQAYDPIAALEKYNVVWDSPSKDAWGTMPAGNGDLSLNVWMEESGDLLFYIGKTDSWDDNCRLLKLGRVRVRLNPNPLLKSKVFKQTLRLSEAAVEIKCGQGQEQVELKVWADANHPVIHVAVKSKKPVEATATVELWRTEPYELPTIEVSDVHFDHYVPGNKHFPTIVEPDTVLTGLKDRIGWYHHNRKSVGPALAAKLQDMEGFKQEDPILHRTFGAVITAERAEKN